MSEPDVINAFKGGVFMAYVALVAWAFIAALRHYPSAEQLRTFEGVRKHSEANTAMLWCCVALLPGGLALVGWFWG